MASGQELRPAQAGALALARVVEVLPFEDGNGRVSRLAASQVMVRAGARPPILVKGDRPRLEAALQAAFRLDTEPLVSAPRGGGRAQRRRPHPGPGGAEALAVEAVRDPARRPRATPSRRRARRDPRPPGVPASAGPRRRAGRRGRPGPARPTGGLPSRTCSIRRSKASARRDAASARAASFPHLRTTVQEAGHQGQRRRGREAQNGLEAGPQDARIGVSGVDAKVQEGEPVLAGAEGEGVGGRHPGGRLRVREQAGEIEKGVGPVEAGEAQGRRPAQVHRGVHPSSEDRLPLLVADRAAEEALVVMAEPVERLAQRLLGRAARVGLRGSVEESRQRRRQVGSEAPRGRPPPPPPRPSRSRGSPGW